MRKVDPSNQDVPTQADNQVGRRLKELRNRAGLSLRVLAERSMLNVNTLSMLENGKTSPSVSTLQQLAGALGLPISSFFESDQVKKRVVFTAAGDRPSVVSGSPQMLALAKGLEGYELQPFLVTLEPGMGSGERLIVHTGHEFVYCLSGSVHFTIDEQPYPLEEGDSLVFEAHLPHRWENQGAITARILLVLQPADEREEPVGRHISLNYSNKELTMKIAAITDDGKTISQHFGRAPYYLVLTIEDGKVVNQEMRNKLGHSQFGGQEHAEQGQGGHGRDAGSHNKHVSMAEAIADCTVLLCGGMGMGAYESMRRLNITPVVTDLSGIDEAVQAFIDGKLVDHTELLH